MEHLLSDPPGLLVEPDGEPRCAVVVLSGSSGRLEVDRARRFAEHGAVAAAMTYFGGPGQPPGLCEVALETFTPVLDLLAQRSDHLVVWGASKGAEAALLLAAADQRVGSVIAIAPTAFVWPNTGPGVDGAERPWRSSWTRSCQPLPFLPLVEDWQPSASERNESGVAVRGWYEASLAAASQEQLRAAAIPVEDTEAQVVLVAGGDDRVWPSVRFAEEIVQRRARRDLPTVLLADEGAGHRVVLPHESAGAGGGGLLRGGSSRADARLGARLWDTTRTLLELPRLG